MLKKKNKYKNILFENNFKILRKKELYFIEIL